MSEEAAATARTGPDYDTIVANLKTVFDPEIPVDIWDLGLIYDLTIHDDRSVDVLMTLTAPGCPVAGELVEQTRQAVLRTEGVRDARVELTWEPPWTPDRLSEEARIMLDMF